MSDPVMERRLREWQEHERWYRDFQRRTRRRRRRERLQALVRWLTGRT
jgi:hypothetical protein